MHSIPHHTLHKLLPSAFGLAVAIVLCIGDAAAQKPIELLEPLPDGTTEIGITAGAHPLEPLNAYLRPFIPWAIGTAAGLAVLMIMVGGFQIMLSGGEQGKQSAGKDRVLAAIFGLLILVFSSVILYFLNASFFRISS